MRLLIVGTLNGQLSTATKMAMAKGAKVTHTETVDQAIDTLRSGRGADLMMVDVAADIANLIARLQGEHICVPVVACGVETDARAAVNAIRAGAGEYIPLPPDAELIAAVLAAVADESHALVFQDPKMAGVVKLADQVAASEASILITGESGTGKEVMAHYVHGRLSAPRQALHLGQLRRNPRKPARVGAFRARKRRFHRRHCATHRQVRGSGRRHAASRRNQRNGYSPPGEAVARHSGARHRPRWRQDAGPRRYPHHRDIEPRPAVRGARRPIPRRPFLSFERGQSSVAAAA